MWVRFLLLIVVSNLRESEFMVGLAFWKRMNMGLMLSWAISDFLKKMLIFVLFDANE